MVKVKSHAKRHMKQRGIREPPKQDDDENRSDRSAKHSQAGE